MLSYFWKHEEYPTSGEGTVFLPPTTGLYKDNGKLYYMDRSSAMLTCRTKIDNKWYYMDRNGAMQTGWPKLGGKWYYLKSNGSMAANTTIGGGYRLGSDGVWIK